MRRRPTKDEVKDPELLFRLLADMAAEVADLGAQVSKPAPPLPATEAKRMPNVLNGVDTPGGAIVKLGVDVSATAKSNLTATVDPTTDDDNSKGYALGSVWISQRPTAGPTTTYTVFMLANAQTTAARWVQLGQLVITPGP